MRRECGPRPNCLSPSVRARHNGLHAGACGGEATIEIISKTGVHICMHKRPT